MREALLNMVQQRASNTLPDIRWPDEQRPHKLRLYNANKTTQRTVLFPHPGFRCREVDLPHHGFVLLPVACADERVRFGGAFKPQAQERIGIVTLPLADHVASPDDRSSR